MLDGNNNLGKDPPTQITTIHDLTAAHECSCYLFADVTAYTST